MAKPRQKKEQEVQALADKFARSKAAVFATLSGVPVADSEKLRNALRGANGELKAIKKTLLKRAVSSSGIDVDAMGLSATIGVAFSYEDEVSAAKAMHDFSKASQGLKIVGGYFEQRFIPATQVIALAQLPGKQEMRATLVRTIQAPVAGFVNVLAANLRQLVFVISAIKESKSAN